MGLRRAVMPAKAVHLRDRTQRSMDNGREKTDGPRPKRPDPGIRVCCHRTGQLRAKRVQANRVAADRDEFGVLPRAPARSEGFAASGSKYGVWWRPDLSSRHCERSEAIPWPPRKEKRKSGIASLRRHAAGGVSRGLRPLDRNSRARIAREGADQLGHAAT